MLVCVNCHMEYEDGTPSCANCGGTLSPKEGLKTSEKDVPKPEATKLDQRLICPRCHILYEKLSTCIRCGSPLVTQAALKEMKEPPPSEPERPERKAELPPKAKQEPPSPTPPRKRPVEAEKEELQPAFGTEIGEGKPVPSEMKERRALRSLPREEEEGLIYPAEAVKRFLRSRTGILVMVLFCLGLLYVLLNMFSAKGRVTRGTPPAQRTSQTGTEEASTISKEPSPALPSSALPVVLMPQEVQRLLDLLENVRQANLKKNIELLMSCYASDYKDLEERRRTALQSWSKYNYLDLSYTLKLESLLIDSAKARVEWWVRSIPLTGGEAEEGRSVLNVIFKKENGQWKIKEVSPYK